jgi:hypothetical protein
MAAFTWGLSRYLMYALPDEGMSQSQMGGARQALMRE